jgi:hypothetical protein
MYLIFLHRSILIIFLAQYRQSSFVCTKHGLHDSHVEVRRKPCLLQNEYGARFIFINLSLILPGNGAPITSYLKPWMSFFFFVWRRKGHAMVIF